MTTPTKLLATLVLTGAAILMFAACNFITTPPVGGPGGGDAAPTEPPATSPPAQPPPATAIVPATAVQGQRRRHPARLDDRHGIGWPLHQAVVRPATPLTIDTSVSYTAVLNTTAGPITVELLTGDAPNTVNNFVFLAREGFYDNVIFHRTIPGFMIQGGDPTGTGGGGPGYRFADEPVRRPYARGVMAMANAGPNTNGSQFFLMHADYQLSPDYTIFGQTISGVEAIDAIATAPTKAGAPGHRAGEPGGDPVGGNHRAVRSGRDSPAVSSLGQPLWVLSG